MSILEQSRHLGRASLLLGEESSELANELELALRLGQIEIRFQPQFACDSGRLVGAEALARWIHPTYGEIGANALFDIAAKAGLASELPRHVLSLAIKHARKWPDALGLSLNVTPRQLLDENFVAQLTAALGSAQIASHQVTLEITEELLLDDLDLAARQLMPLRALGMRIALDDFGAGFCNFDYLKRLPIDALKLDRSMISGIAESERDLAVLRAIVTLARALELDVVAEGIEKVTQRDVVIAEGCSTWQGFLGSRPLDRDRFGELYERC